VGRLREFEMPKRLFIALRIVVLILAVPVVTGLLLHRFGPTAEVDRWWNANVTHGLLAGPYRDVTLIALGAAILFFVILPIWQMVRVKGPTVR
jgi:hypothetical protein